MTIIDTSVWVNHLRGTSTPLPELLTNRRALIHPFVVGELMLGGLPRDAMRILAELRRVRIASTSEVAASIGWFGLAGTGIGYVDTHLLVAAKAIKGGCLLTHDRKLHAQAERLGLAYA